MRKVEKDNFVIKGANLHAKEKIKDKSTGI